MQFVIYDSLKRSKVPFNPIDPHTVKMYTCGPTVYANAHIGNFRTYIFEDLLRRTLRYLGYNVIQVMNLTDVDDKTIRESRAAGVSLNEFTKPIIEQFFEDLDNLKIERAEYYPAATDHIPEMIRLVSDLLDKGYAYKMDGSVYFSIQKYPEYGKLSRMKLEKLARGVRIDADEYEKDDFRDFALWRGWTEDDGDVGWDAPFGRGRPGWHVECSAMSMKYLGSYFDLHTGGIDNLFPHHENEIAQSVCATGKEFVHYWMHSAHLVIDGEKMSKSLGNFFTLRDLMAKGHSPRSIRYVLLTNHYRQRLNLTEEVLQSAVSALERLDSLRHVAEDAEGEGVPRDGFEVMVNTIGMQFMEALADDLNISAAMVLLFELVTQTHKLALESRINRRESQILIKFWDEADTVLGILTPPRNQLSAEIKKIISERLLARSQKNFSRSDEIRDHLAGLGYNLKDSRGGTVVIWKEGREIVK